jgi:Pyruvate/2-oxoacid:ferredoxin oxidoreductase gamma subunit
MTKTYQLGVLRDRTAEAAPRPDPPDPPALERIPEILGLANGLVEQSFTSPSGPVDLAVKVAGFGGQGVLLLGEVLAEAALAAGLEVSWLPSYGPEQRSGTSNCHVRLCSQPIDSPLVSRPNVLVAMNEPSARKFAASVTPGGWIFYNGSALPEGCDRGDVHVVAQPFNQIASDLGEPRAANMVMLGALLEATGVLPEEPILAVLRKFVKNVHWFEVDRLALSKGRDLLRGVV